MPHGSGHHGGGGGGGFHHHGGGGGFHHHGGGGGWGHHHYRHNRHHHHRVGGGGVGWGWGWGWGTYGYGGYRYHRRRFYRSWGWGIGALTAITLIIVLSVTLSIRYSDNKDSTSNYAPGDTRIFSFSSTLCQGLTVSGDSQASVYLLENTPSLSGPVKNLTARPPDVIEADTYHFLKYYLYAGSKMSMHYCLSSSSSPPVRFFLIRGNDNWKNWEEDGSSSHSKISFNILNQCSSGSIPVKDYTFGYDDYYYFAFDVDEQRIDSNLNASILLQRREYLLLDTPIVDQCHSVASGCSISIPYRSNYVALLNVSNDALAEENLDFDWSCEARAWIYVIIVLIPLVFVASVTVFVCIVVIVYAQRKKEAQGYTAVGTTPTNAQPVTPEPTTTVTVTATAPLPTNPAYPPAPPDYGSTQFNTPGTEEPPAYSTAVKM